MLNKLNVSVFVISILVVGSAFSEEIKQFQTPFLSQPQQLVMQPAPENTSEDCTDTRNSDCLYLVGNGGHASGGISGSNNLSAYLPNVMVTMYVTDIELEAINIHPFNESNIAIFWDTYSDEADIQTFQTMFANINTANEFIDYTGEYGPKGFPIYQAIIYGACNTFNSFNLTHEAVIATGSQNPEYGDFSGVDNNTIDDTGFYNMDYTFLVENGNSASYAHVHGSVDAICTTENSID